MNKDEKNIIRCPHPCDKKVHCFVCKLLEGEHGTITILHKCPKTKEDLPIQVKAIG